MSNHKIINELINFLKEIKIGLSTEEIKSTYDDFLSSENKNLEIDNVYSIGCSLWSDEKLDFIGE